MLQSGLKPVRTVTHDTIYKPRTLPLYHHIPHYGREYLAMGGGKNFYYYYNWTIYKFLTITSQMSGESWNNVLLGYCINIFFNQIRLSIPTVNNIGSLQPCHLITFADIPAPSISD